jgi:hypothetical protein
MASVHPIAASSACICFTRPLREAFVGVCRAGPSEYRTSPRQTAAAALLEALRIGAWLQRHALPGAPL